MRRRLVVAARSLLGHSRTTRQVIRGRAELANQVQVAMFAAGRGPDMADLLGPHRELLSSPGELGLFVGVALALPGNEDAAVLEQWRGELGEGGEAADGAGSHCCVCLASLTSGELLGTGVDDASIGDPRSGDRALDEIALAPHRLNQ